MGDRKLPEALMLSAWLRQFKQVTGTSEGAPLPSFPFWKGSAGKLGKSKAWLLTPISVLNREFSKTERAHSSEVEFV